jgi:hypothetical protein
MTNRSLVVGCIATMSLVVAVAAQTAPPQPARPAAAPPTTASPSPARTATQAAKAPAPAAAGLVATSADEKKLLDQYCLACHSERAKASMDSARKLSIDSLDLNNMQAHADKWELIVRKLRAGMMPPPPMKRPEAAQYESMIAYLENQLDKTAVTYLPPPGLHRLNRTEYANMIKDMLALEIDAAKYLPNDDSTHGFDNQAGALGLSSTLVEAYVSAAQKISRLALGEAEPPTLVVHRTPEDTSQDYHVEGLPFGTRGGLLVNHVFPSDGEYTITVTPIFGDNMSPTGFGSVPCEKIEILVDNERLGFMDWNGGGRNTPGNCGGAANRGRGAGAAGRAGGAAGAAGRAGGQRAGGAAPAAADPAGPQGVPAAEAAAQAAQAGPEAFGRGGGGGAMRIRQRITAGEHMVGATFLATNYAPLLDLDQHFMRSTLQTGPTPGYTFYPHVGTIRIEGPFNSAAAKDSPSRRKIFVCTPTSAADEAACARKIVTSLATKAFRRPATPADIDSLMEFYQTGRKEGDFNDGVEMMLSRILASPQFIYRIEEQPAGGVVRTAAAAAPQQGPAYRITDIDLASRLSFFLWSTGPDDQLLKLASTNKLHEPLVLEQQVRRMLKDERAEALAINFAGQWLNLRGMAAVGPLPTLYPDFDDPLRQAMRREVELLFDSIIREDRSVVDLLTANDTFVNERLAKHYGIPNVYGSHFRRIQLPPAMDVRRGLLGKGSFLIPTAKPERNSPVVRGNWVMTNILGMKAPDPPPDVPALPPRAADPNAKEPTMRQKMEMHRVRADCVQCHRLMEPIGFALENFDAIALWRSHDEGQPIDAASQTFDGTNINGPNDLRNWIVSKYSNTFVQLAAEKLMTYALGRGVEYQDMPLVRAIARDAHKSGDKFSSLVMGVVKSKPFQMNMKVEGATAPLAATVSTPSSDKGNN